MTVAQWHDLAVFFVNGGFGGFVYDYKGWYSSGIYFAEQVSSVPPAGTKMTPLLETNGGITVGDVVTPPKSLSYETKDGYETLSGTGFTDSVSLTLAEIEESVRNEARGKIVECFRPGMRRMLIIGILLAVFQQVTGINVVTGNCGE